MRSLIVTSAAALATAITAGGMVAAGAGTATPPAPSLATAGAFVSASGAAPQLTVQSSAAGVETPSGTYLRITRATFRSPAGPVTVRFSGGAYAIDWTGPDARFVGRSYSALLVRVLLDGAALSPGAVTFGDNTGKIPINEMRPRASSFEWVGRVPAGSHRVDVQFRNRTTWDRSGVTNWSLAIQHP